MKVKKSLLTFISPGTDLCARLKIARKEDSEFKTLSPADRVTVLFILSYARETELADIATASLESAPESLLLSALAEGLDVLILRYLFVQYRDNGPILSAIASNAGIDSKLAGAIAEKGPREALNAFGSHPYLHTIFASIAEGLKKNPIVDVALVEQLTKAAQEAQKKAEAESVPAEEDLSDLIAQEENFDSDRFNVYQAICGMTAGEKIKLAHTGDRSVRNLLIKDKNRVVSLSVLKNPKLTEQEVVMIVSSTSVSEEIIREIAQSRQWMKCYKVKTAMVLNPHTPLCFSLKIIDYLRDRELKQLSKSKGVPGALVNSAIRKLKLKHK